MAKNIYVNLPVKDLQQSINFFTKLGFTFNQQFTDDSATCMVISENIFCMLLVEDKFKQFTRKPISDAKKATEVLIALDVESRVQVDEMVQKAVDAGGSLYLDPQDHGWMYSQSFADLDGHQWEVFYMDASQMPK